ncbi:MAG: hypothetical protein ACPL1A_00890 [Candidatus Kapaibacteriota bacterium]
MNKFFLILSIFVLFAITEIKAQVSFSCNYREYCDWNEKTQKFETKCDGYEESSLFVMNKNETMFTHTTPEMKSTYYVDKKEYDEQNDVYTYDVTSDVGNKYFYIFDVKNKEIRAVFEQDGKTILLRFYVKAIF